MGLIMLKDRRERGDAIQTLKVQKGIKKVECEKWFQTVPDETRPTRATSTVIRKGKW